MSDLNLAVAVLMGGVSAEAEVSRRSAQQICLALEEEQHTATPIELDSNCAQALLNLQPDVVFPALHGPPGEDGTVQGFLELLGLPYVGSGVRGSAMAMDKAVAKSIFRHHGLPVANDIVVPSDGKSSSESSLKDTAAEILDTLGPAVVIKPLNQGSAIGVTPLPNGGDIVSALRSALCYGSCMVEPYVIGKEITVGILQTNDELIAHPVIEIVTASEQWYDYENRYTEGQSEHVIPALLGDDLNLRLQEIATAAHRVLALDDLSRADFIVTDTGEITLLEVNTLPGMTPTSLYPDGARALGYDFPKLIDHLIVEAFHRGPRLDVAPAVTK